MTTSEPSVDQETVEEIIADWPEKPSEVAEKIMDKHGSPDEAAPSELLWYDTGPWKRTELYRDGVPHNFPKEHTDHLRQVIDYHVPPEKFDDLAQFDGSVYIDRTNGELAAKCEKEPANFVALNLAHDIITDEKSVDEAREEYAKTMVKKEMGASPDLTEGFQFDLPEDKQRDPDETIVTDAMKAEVKEMFGGEAEAAEE